MNDTDDEHAILDLAHAAHAAHTAGQHDTAGTLLTTLTTSYEMAHIAAVMCQRDARDRIGAEAALLQLFGPTMLYGHTHPTT